VDVFLQTDTGGNPYLMAGRSRTPRPQAGLDVVQAAFVAVPRPRVVLYVEPDDLPGFRQVNGRRDVTVRGRCRGPREDRDTTPDFYLVLHGCVVVPEK
jgi:hypothetical protein